MAAAAVLVAAVAARVLLAAPQGQPAAGTAVDFARDIQPILKTSCFQCHGPTRARGGLRLDVRSAAMRGGDSGPVLTPGRSGESLIVRRILGLDGEDLMPKEGDRLTAAQVALIRAWIDQGAPWPEAVAGDASPHARHWAYVRPVAARPPDVADAKWARNEIDRFVLARLEKDGLKPAAEAPFETLVRRVFLDLIGLPPTVAELDAALADAASAGRDAAYEHVVDRLLASPHYGERWARTWLDLARYADSHGYEKDRLRVMWKYRDWVIETINADMPFNQFTIEQIAGDMLPAATDAQRVASGFHRNTMLNQEGGIDVEEARWETLVDRVNTTATVWLGSTVACAQCHDHKYDPFSQRDYYRLLAFFENVEYTVAGQQGGDRFANEPQINLPTPDQESRRKQLQAEIDTLNASLRAETPARAAAQVRWEQSVLAAERAWVPLKSLRFTSTGGSAHEQLDDGSIVVSDDNPSDNSYTVTAKAPIAGIRGIRIEALPDPRLPQGGPGRDRYGNFVLNGFEVTTGTDVLAKPVTFDAVKADDASITVDSFRAGADSSSYVPRGWTIDATRDPSTGRVRRQAVFASKLPFATIGTQLTVTLRHVRRPIGQSLGRFRLSVTASPAPLKVAEVPARQRALLLVPAARRSDQQRREAASLFRNIAAFFKSTRDRLAALQTAMRDLGIVTALVMKEKAGHDRPSTFVRRRGNFLDKGQQVFADVPDVLHPLPEDAMPNRLGLARWLVDEQNPLTARVTVNRAWEQFFGRGLVETSEDFGVKGTPPSHPELLDWLAMTFMEQGWRTKALHRSIVMSATYRQSSAVSGGLLERDPYNRLFARGPRFRVEAEMVRDIALAASGLLSRRIGGPSVFPPQPDGIWQNPYSSDKWVLSEGEDRYRRGLYTFLRRTAPYPAFTTFDATSRESCTVRRVRTNTPLQALTTLNDEAFFEAARALARRMLTEVDHGSGGGNGATDSSRARASHGFRLCVARMPQQKELERIISAFAQHLEQFRRHPEQARKVVSGVQLPGIDVAEQAAWTLVANALLNLDETVTKE
jgi:mono/diheme cytochrome c family protein